MEGSVKNSKKFYQKSSREAAGNAASFLRFPRNRNSDNSARLVCVFQIPRLKITEKNLILYLTIFIQYAINKLQERNIDEGESNLLITRETDYALRILRALSDGEQATAKEICRRELLPQQFVYKILKKLSRAGIVQITRGADGGCRLAADLRKVSLYDLTQVMEDDNYISACMQPGYQCEWRQKHSPSCKVNKQLLQIQSVLDREFRARSLYQMIYDSE
ncbi:HTH-type transcriptional repressor NsrR [Caproiciproducens galactitolivorans]|uniref:HTH-type transcriptional repressor NsrR n=1 Tax=Caproiciproducens galactitolivorans TaxID=642589 RepID=A0A4Z0Y0I9_9FIRM|nr:HTH-type transcriptional repressor NsrR [Caproiciproducens galactitolivorans]